MFLRHKIRRKDGKEHRTFSIVENRRLPGGRVVQRHVLYLGEINDSQELAWRKSVEVFEDVGGDINPRANGAAFVTLRHPVGSRIARGRPRGATVASRRIR